MQYLSHFDRRFICPRISRTAALDRRAFTGAACTSAKVDRLLSCDERKLFQRAVSVLSDLVCPYGQSILKSFALSADNNYCPHSEELHVGRVQGGSVSDCQIILGFFF